jgi:hypothetical protein
MDIHARGHHLRNRLRRALHRLGEQLPPEPERQVLTSLKLVDGEERPVETLVLPAPLPWYAQRRVHLLVGLIVAVLAAFWAGQRAADGVRSNLDARLRDAGAGADAALVTLEAEQLSALRAVTFTQGVAGALATHDVPALNRLVTPLQANADVPMVDVVLPSGRVALAVRSRGAPAPVASRAGLPVLAETLREANGPREGRFSEVAIFKTGAVLLTIGPVVSGSKPVGAVLVMTPLADALGRISQQVRTTVTAYDANGSPLATTSPGTPAGVEHDTARGLIGGGPIVVRGLAGGNREALGRLIVDHQANALLGVSLHDNSWVTGRAVALYAGLGLLATMLIVGSFSLRLANRWWI